VLFAVLGFLVVPSLSGNDSIRFPPIGHFAVGRSDISAHSALPFLVAVMTALYLRLTVYHTHRRQATEVLPTMSDAVREPKNAPRRPTRRDAEMLCGIREIAARRDLLAGRVAWALVGLVASPRRSPAPRPPPDAKAEASLC